MGKKSVLITGTNGFIGGNLAMQFSVEGHKVFSIDDSYLAKPDWGFQLNSILDTLDPDAVFHVGACSDTLESDVNYMMIRNYESTKIITDWCSKYDKPLIYSSSAANYGSNNHYPSNLYGWSKYAAEGYVCSNGGIALRYFNVYGPGEEHKGRMASVALQMYRRKEKGLPISIFPKEPKRDFVYIRDVISANMFALKNSNDLKGKFYDVGFGEPRLFEDVLNNLKIGDFSYTSEQEIPEGYQFYTCSNHWYWMPGWKAKWSLESGIEEYKNYLETGEYDRSPD